LLAFSLLATLRREGPSMVSLAESGASYLLTVRSERPVEGCELTPNAFLQLKGGIMDNSTRAKLLDSKPFEYRFRWFRAPRARICAGPSCPRGDSCDPVHWSKASLGGPGLLCNVCLTAGRPAHDVAFCSARWAHMLLRPGAIASLLYAMLYAVLGVSVYRIPYTVYHIPYTVYRILA
jgi:hypothetical protein